ncbi:conserved Plasmodium protein, unknown function [Plasmodium gallinaceum]|uniref:Uncharacterized protein n=1 Tax=Plasmodium gallinaceum TaxID=5849 RepID=A0A1J1GS21_PLAGA|nr:conserved Plasmodium protein, unknown function [Plasmodium gallinaceum]CRG95271.1 conserved Plasmodium protein, unknown function [Plasmodium gallinaceum]
MLKFSKHACHQIFCSENYVTKRINNLNNSLLCLRTNDRYKKYKFCFRDYKNFNVLKDYIFEKKSDDEKINIKKSEFFNKNEIYYCKKNNVDSVLINENLYNNLKNIFVLIDRINRYLVKQNSLKYGNIFPYKIIENNVNINRKLYLFYLELPSKYESKISFDIEIIFHDKNFLDLCKEIKSLDFYSLVSFFFLYKKIINYKCDSFKIISFFREIHKFILQNLCILINNITSNYNENNKNHEKNIRSNKLSFHQTYIEILNVLNVLKNNRKKYINFINFILYTQHKNVYKHNHHYNYFYSIRVLHLVNEIIFFQLNSFNINCNNEERISNNFCTILNDNYFYIQKDKFTWNYIEKYYEEKEFYDNNNNNMQKELFYNNKDLNNDIYNFKQYSINDLKNNKKHTFFKEPLIYEECNNKDNQKYYYNGARDIIKEVDNAYKYISKDINCSFLFKHNIILLTIIVKKIKYIENRTLNDIQCILESINLLMHVNNKLVNLNKLVNEKDTFLRNTISSKYNESLFFLSFLNFVFNILKNLKYSNNYLKITKTYNGNENFFKILSLISNIRYLLTINNKNNVNQNTSEYQIECENKLIEIKFIKKNLINKINKNICLLTNEIILTYSNYIKSFHDNDVNFNHSLLTYLSYVLNDLYIQNNYQIKKFIFSYFLKYYKIFNSMIVSNKTDIYLQYITIYNFLKLFKNAINESSGEYDDVLRIFMGFFDSNICQKLSEDKFMNNFRDKDYIKYYLHFLNKLCYFFILSKKLITNREFLNHINYHFYLTFYSINIYIEKNMNNSELFIYFINKCVNKIIVILVINKYFNMLGEDLIKCLLKFINYTHNIINNEKKRKILIYIVPFIKQEKHILDNLKYFLINKEITQCNIGKKIRDNYTDESSNYEIEKKGNDFLCTSVKSNPSIDKENNLNSKAFNNFEEKKREDINESCKDIKMIPSGIIENFEKIKDSKLKNNELYVLLDMHMKENYLIKKENTLLKNKLNYIVLNFEKFISSYINVLISQSPILLYKKQFMEVENKNDCVLTKKKIKINNIHSNELNKEKNIANLSIKFDYQQVDVKNEYFYKLKKYENKNCIKINNILVNMYMYNPHICVKDKNIFLTKDKKHKKIIILPYDVYKNIQKLVNYEESEELNLFKKLKCSICSFFYKLKIFLSKKLQDKKKFS